MIHRIKEWTDPERTTGQRVTDAWETFLKTKREDVIDRSKEIHETARITEVQDKHEAELLALENVVGVGPTLKVKKGKPTTQWCLSVLVEQKLPQDRVPSESRVPGTVEGVPTDVVQVGKIELLTFNTRVRPALPGYSIGHQNITAGTFGCVVRDIRRCCCKLAKDCCCSPTGEECLGDYLILSNNHVLANLNQAKPGDLILQPGPLDGGVYPSDAVAKLERFEEITFGFAGYNLVDAAVARPLFSRNVTASILGQIMPRGIGEASFFGTPVLKVGRTTQVTTGFVLSPNFTVAFGVPGFGFVRFHHQILTTPMGAPGDSGSLLMDSNLNAVGLLWAGSPLATFFNHIADVETALGVRPLTAARSS